MDCLKELRNMWLLQPLQLIQRDDDQDAQFHDPCLNYSQTGFQLFLDNSSITSSAKYWTRTLENIQVDRISPQKGNQWTA